MNSWYLIPFDFSFTLIALPLYVGSVDSFVGECMQIILIDLILHKPKAYRHLLYNVLNQQTVELEVQAAHFDCCLYDIGRICKLNILIGHPL